METKCPKCGSKTTIKHSKREFLDGAKTKPNPNFGRAYYSCSGRSCDWFGWVEGREGDKPASSPKRWGCPKCGGRTEIGKSKRRFTNKNGNKVLNPNFGRTYYTCPDCGWFVWGKEIGGAPKVAIRSEKITEAPEKIEETTKSEPDETEQVQETQLKSPKSATLLRREDTTPQEVSSCSTGKEPTPDTKSAPSVLNVRDARAMFSRPR